jgi:hypothetical protein
MFSAIKELIVVLTLATAVFVLAKPLCLRFMQPADFSRRRNLWFLLTTSAFVLPSFWLYAGVAAVATIWGARRDSNPVALYLLLYAIIPNLSWYIPFPGMNQLFDLSQARLVALLLLVPLALQLAFAAKSQGDRRWTFLDTLVVAYAVLQIVLIIPYETVTNTMRRSLLVFLDFAVVCYVFSRALDRREKIVDAMAVFVLLGAVAAAIGTFESLRGWLMYEHVGRRWGAMDIGAFLLRLDTLRAQASHSHSLRYGYVLAMALAFWLYLRMHIESRGARWGTTALLCAGIYFSLSRGPWFTAIAVYFLYLLLSPGGMAGFVKGIALTTCIAVGLAFTPMGQRAISLMPFIGTTEQGSVSQRQQLAETSWQLIWLNPVFGDPFVLRRMEHLRLGGTIIDLMNGYATVALFTGLTGLALFVALFFGSMAIAWRAMRRLRSSNPDVSAMGAALVAAMLGSAIFMGTASIDWVEYVLIGMAAAYVAAARAQGMPVADRVQIYPTQAVSGFRRRSLTDPRP